MRQKALTKYLLGAGIIVLILLSGTTNLFAQSITLDSPNGDEVWSVGTTHTISWTWTAIDDVKLYYSPDNFVAVTKTIVSGLPISNTGNYEWTIPNDISPDFRFKVKVADASNPAVYDVSDNPFKIRADIMVTAPVAVFAGDPTYDDQSNETAYPGLQWATAKLHNITWQITGTVPTILIECLKISITPTEIISPVANTGIGSYEWEVFNYTTMAGYQPVTATIRISDTRDISASAESDIFTICYYKIVWNLIDDVTGTHLKALTVQCDQSGWSESWISSPKTKYYPYGQYGPTKWRKTGYLETAEEDWWADADKSFTMQMESSVVHYWQVMADFNYNEPADRLEVTSWLMRDGLILPEPDSVTIDIYDHSGGFIKTLESSSPDSIGVFRITWNNPGLDSDQTYTAYVTIVYTGKPFKSVRTYNISDDQIIVTGSSGDDDEHKAWYKPQTWKCGLVGLEALLFIFMIGLLRRRKPLRRKIGDYSRSQ